MKYKNFLLRAVNLLLILGVLWQYQQVALVRAAAVSQRKQEIAEVEPTRFRSAGAERSTGRTDPERLPGRHLRGSAFGFGDVIRVSVTIQNGKMTDIAVLDASGEDKPTINRRCLCWTRCWQCSLPRWIPFPALLSRQRGSSVQ